jgi:hypothetical protein
MAVLFLSWCKLEGGWFGGKVKSLWAMIKAKAHKEGVRIGKTPKKLASICCP